MGLNRSEDAFLAYLRGQADEQRFWHMRVLELDRAPGPLESRTAALERELRAYADERSRADAALGEALGGGKVSLRKLAEFLLATWPPPRPVAKKKSAR